MLYVFRQPLSPNPRDGKKSCFVWKTSSSSTDIIFCNIRMPVAYDNRSSRYTTPGRSFGLHQQLSSSYAVLPLSGGGKPRGQHARRRHDGRANRGILNSRVSYIILHVQSVGSRFIWSAAGAARRRRLTQTTGRRDERIGFSARRTTINKRGPAYYTQYYIYIMIIYTCRRTYEEGAPGASLPLIWTLSSGEL
jgi:hypothetical protein